MLKLTPAQIVRDICIFLLDLFVWYECMRVSSWLMEQPSDLAVFGAILLGVISTLAMATVLWFTVKEVYLRVKGSLS